MKKQLNVIGLCTLLALPMAAGNAGAAPQSDPMLEAVVVTASRTAQSVDDTLAAVTVISRQDLERGQFSSLPEALATVPGLQISRSGGRGKETNIHLRGTSTSQTLVMVDGVRLGSATLGRPSLQHIPLSQIERIEVVRGPRSTLYGSDAMGGVIHIITRRGQEETRGNISAGAGSHRSYETQAAIAGAHGDSHYSLSGGHFYTRGFDARRNDVPDPSGWGNTPDEPDRDGYRESSASIRLGHRFAPGHEVELHGLHSSGTTEFDGWENETDFRQQVLGLNWRLMPADFWDITLQAAQSWDDSKNYSDGTYSSRFDTKRDQLGWQNDFFLNADNTLTLGVDYHKDRVSGSTDYDEDSRYTTGYYAQHQLNHGRHGFMLGMRYEDNEQFGSHTTYNLGYGLQLPRNTRLTLNYGTAFRAPTFNDLYWPADPVWGGGGNPDLKPEESKSYEAALQQSYQGGHWRLGVFRTDIDEMISGWPPENVNRARIDGLELESGHYLGEHWQLGAVVTILSPKDRDSDLLLPRRARRTAAINLDGDFGRWRSGVSMQAVGKRYDDAANQTRLAGYALLFWRAEYELSDNWLLQGKIDNLLDKDYEEVATYNTPGRTFFATLHYRF
ncbi:TonB-dependent receptor domain-containing protein [Desulfurivibrio alkaliphilus]|uniref:TonB-dependent receptor plug n=1 Tax=Desulfurivibrio alkaliphilus (strain DSM 19089 / UNIQEM U267 / AHT2) TaxID=589865 RepID=D6Z3X4_DESAT|nr:TonB-dependent receptor [Desulfurivibrio alkaliphilus]ADH86249.1 TonB-dependent receptor plug [Desulfurivibrio alkaliphilus AHT 2]